jgi:phosphoglycerol transferase MdoB-like AlkP superfamily enzyme
MDHGTMDVTRARLSPRWLRLLGVAVLSGTLLRLALVLRLPGQHGAVAWTGTLARGFALDALVVLACAGPPLALLALRRTHASSRLVRSALFLGLWAFVFLKVVEYYFFLEFDARFNHLAIDYVLFPGEVAGNVWESYPVPLTLALTGVAAALTTQWVALGCVRPVGRRSVRSAGAFLAVSVAALSGLACWPASDGGDRQLAELASNDAVSLARAVRTASLDYAAYYRTVSPEQLDACARREFGWPSSDHPEKTFRAVERRDRPLDVVVVLGESFGSEFVGRLGGTSPCAPGLERWAERGLLLTHLVATGNRTVRGLEGVLCSFVPLPGDSIWKRDRSHGLATIAGVLRDQGYSTEFLYGGDGSFDSMRSFALDNGWDSFLDDSLVGRSSFPADAYRTIWGVADEHLYDALLERQRSAARSGKPLFATALTVSNHRPFLTPDTVEYRVRFEKLLERGPLLAALLAGSILLAWHARRRRGPVAGVLVGLVALGCVLLLTWTEISPKDTRVAAVSYADRALADYLDRASAEGLLDHTVVLFVGDHGARVYGSQEIPAASYRIPALFLAPEERYHGRTLDRLCSQVDLAPTLLSLAGIDYSAPFFGNDLLAEPDDDQGRAWLLHNRNVGLLTDTTLTVLGLHGRVIHYRRPDRDSDDFEPIESCPDLEAMADRGAAVFQIASTLYDTGQFRLPGSDATAKP